MRRPAALLCALVLVAIQAAAVAHDHAATTTPAGNLALVCDLCTGFQPAAPAPDMAAPERHAVATIPAAAAPAVASLPIRFSRANRSRAPPALQSI